MCSQDVTKAIDTDRQREMTIDLDIPSAEQNETAMKVT